MRTNFKYVGIVFVLPVISNYIVQIASTIRTIHHDFIISYIDKHCEWVYSVCMGDKIEEELEKMQARRNAIWNDLRSHGATLSAVSQVVLIAEIASIDVHIKDMKDQLEDMGWHEFIQAAWKDE